MTKSEKQISRGRWIWTRYETYTYHCHHQYCYSTSDVLTIPRHWRVAHQDPLFALASSTSEHLRLPSSPSTERLSSRAPWATMLACTKSNTPEKCTWVGSYKETTAYRDRILEVRACQCFRSPTNLRSNSAPDELHWHENFAKSYGCSRRTQQGVEKSFGRHVHQLVSNI